MSIRLEKLLDVWHSQIDQHQWILATVIETAGSSYRKTGAMMFINDLGQYYGLISGGCLEPDIMRKARRCWDSGQNQTVCYDMRDEDDIGWQLGIGCGGMVKILLQPINKANNFLELPLLKQQLSERKISHYAQDTTSTFPNNWVVKTGEITSIVNSALSSDALTNSVIEHKFTPAPQIAIFGGGVDAQPLAAMAEVLGWRVIMYDPRVNYAQRDKFATAEYIVRDKFLDLVGHPSLTQLDAVVIMTHNVKLDGEALLLVQQSSADFVGLLGPKHRTEKVLKSVGISVEDLQKPLSNPIGLDIGGELPESIALSITAEIHAVLENKIAFTQADKKGLKRVG
ncbi:XdhC family protein [Psychrosphaera sp. 1_MG-2023]|uniref:XdhC family protein n=1 Tax=Psychrosphaera sp. 1_MG-2023 TaxID=3062643 RepID=UPI0026E442D6|nr:XdhC/CoxI family protein [Psychrosphaera sp. 1_MG-2023]MDO6719909.1 XdhC family protein [Psychrosphaera sp. 1_MG-2023]